MGPTEEGRRRSLWKNRDFTKLWTGQAVSQFGNQITGLALPAIAILLLHLSVFEVGLLGAVEFLAFPTIGLFVGVWVDRLERRPILIACNVGRLIALATIPAAFFIGALNIYQLFIIAGVNGVFTVFFDVSYQSYLPSIVEPQDLVEGNSKLQSSASAATVVGPGLAGYLIEAVGPAFSVILDVGGYLVSVLAMTSMKKEESPGRNTTDTGEGRFVAEMKEGVNLILHTKVLAAVTGCVAMANFGYTIAQAVLLFFAFTQLGLTPQDMGLVFTVGGVGFFLGSLVTNRASKRLGMGRAMTFSILSGFAYVGTPLAMYFPPIATLALFYFIVSFPTLIFNVTALSMMQRVTPSRLLGRMNATRRTISWGMIPLGWLVGGTLGATIGLPATIVIGGIIAGASAVWTLLSPVYRLREDNELDSFEELRRPVGGVPSASEPGGGGQRPSLPHQGTEESL